MEKMNCEITENITEIDITAVKYIDQEPAKVTNERNLEELAESIKEVGVINPLIVYEENGAYILVGGVRRWLAAKMAGLKTIPAIVMPKGNTVKFADNVEEVSVNVEAVRRIKELYQKESSELATLTSLTESYEGYRESVKRVMKRRADTKGIVGVVADIFRTEPKYETAVEVALGDSIQSIVTDNEETAKKMIKYLRESKVGRANFIPLTAVDNPSQVKTKEIFNEPGVLGTVNELVHTDPQYEEVAKLLLGEIIAVDNIDNAVKVACKYKYTIKIVTLNGDFISPGGIISGGAFKDKRIARRRKLEDLKRNVSIYKTYVDEFC